MSIDRVLTASISKARVLTACGLITCLVAGCETKPGDSGASSASHAGSAPASHDGDEHGHGESSHAEEGAHDDHTGHDHSHVGVHGGHVVVLEPGHLHAEWVHLDDEEVVEVYLLDKPEEATKVQMLTQVKGQDPVTHDLQAATESLGAGGYMLKNPTLNTSIQMADGETNTVTLIVETAAGTLKAAITDSHDHEH